MIIRRLTALVGVALLVAACSTAAGAPRTPTADGRRRDPGDELGAALVLTSPAPDDRPRRPVRRCGIQVQPRHGFSRLQHVRRRLPGRWPACCWSAGRRHDVMACEGPPPATSRPPTWRSSTRAGSTTSRRDTLTIRGADLTVLLVFDAAPANPLLGAWVVECLRHVAGHHHRAARRHLADGRLPVSPRSAAPRAATPTRSLHDQWHRRRDRPARLHPDGLRR